MNQFVDLMIDIECAGMPPEGALLSIGAVFFDLQTETLGPEFERTVHLASAVRDGGKIDASTFIWWLGQSDAARNGIRFGGQDVRVVLQAFSDWIVETCRHEDVRPWGNSNAFDLGIIGSAYERASIIKPWFWTNERDFRTVRNWYKSRVEYNPDDKGDGAHTALLDAKFQAQHLFKVKNAVRKKT